MTGDRGGSLPEGDRGPIPFEEDDRAVSKPVPKPASRVPAMTVGAAVKAAAAKCPDCGYSLAAIVGGRCPECGGDIGKSSVARERRARADREQRLEYWKWVRIAGLGLLAMAAALAFRGWLGGELSEVPLRIGIALGSYAVLVPIGFLAYMLLAAVWFGSDDPAGITILRLAAVYALADAAAAVVSIVFVLFLTQALIYVTYVGLLMKYLELEMVEAMVMALLTSALRFVAILVVLGMVGVI